MPPDLLPVVGNRDGDWLCLQIDRRCTVGQIVQWYHGGGDWIPWGQTLAEAMLLNTLFHELPGPRRRHAEPAVAPSVPSGQAQQQWVGWASEHLPLRAAALASTKRERSGTEIAETLLQVGVAEVSVRCELIQGLLAAPMSTLDLTNAEKAGWSRQELLEWSFDPQRMPARDRKRLAERLGVQMGTQQDWQAIAEHCRGVLELDSELAWPWDLLGYHAERQGQIEQAIELYQTGATKPIFTSQSIRLGTHWVGDQPPKFSAAMLQRLSPATVECSDYLRILCGADAEERPNQITRYWLRQSDDASASGDLEAAHAFAVAAGWDVGARPLRAYAKLLDRVTVSGTEAGYHARAALASTHRRCLADRYGL